MCCAYGFVTFVSIHLMLLFILPRPTGHATHKSVSIHLMLLFIPPSLRARPAEFFVSIHLMLLFIAMSIRGYGISAICFNTSHVVVYQEEMQRFLNREAGFNTSHVVVYHQQKWVICSRK